MNSDCKFFVENVENVELETEICSRLHETVYLIIGKSLIEFLTANLYSFAKKEIVKVRDSFKNESEKLEDASEDRIKTVMLKDSFIEEMTNRALLKYESEAESLHHSMLAESEKRFFSFFSNSDKAGRKFKDMSSSIGLKLESNLSRASVASLSQVKYKEIRESDSLDQVSESFR